MDLNCAQETNNFLQNVSSLEVWLPAAISVLSLIVNLCFYIFVQPRLSYKLTAKERLANTSVELLNYLTEVISYNDFSGVPTQVRKYSIQIHMHFKSGVASKEIEELLEVIFQDCKRRKSMALQSEIDEWNILFRQHLRRLRIELAKYCGEL